MPTDEEIDLINERLDKLSRIEKRWARILQILVYVCIVCGMMIGSAIDGYAFITTAPAVALLVVVLSKVPELNK